MTIKWFGGHKITGLSTDTKPTAVPVGTTFFEEDSGKTYVWSGTAWREAAASMIDPFEIWFPLHRSSGNQSSETERARYDFCVGYAIRDTYVAATLYGFMHIYVNTTSATYNYRYYAELLYTPNFSTFTTVRSVYAEYSRGAAATGGWYDEYGFNVHTWGVVPAGNFIIVRIRATSWAYGVEALNGAGFKPDVQRLRGTTVW